MLLPPAVPTNILEGRADLKSGGAGRKRRLAKPIVALRPLKRHAAGGVPVPECWAAADYPEVLPERDCPATDHEPRCRLRGAFHSLPYERLLSSL